MSSKRLSTQVHIKFVVVSDARGKFKKCQICGKDFGLFLKEHQCKRCRRAVCQHCASHQGSIITETGPSKQQHRICNLCKEEVDQMKRFIEQSKISLGKDTFSVDWLKAAGLSIDIAKEEYEISNKNTDNAKDKGEFLKMKQELTMAMLELWVNLTYSFREFLHYIMKESDKEVISQQICRVLGALLLHYPQIGYSSDQILLTLFLLCFCSEGSAFALLTILYQDIIPSNTYPANLRKQPYDFSNEGDKVLQVLEQAFKIKGNDLQIIKPFVRNRMPRYLSTLCINFFLFQTSFYFINQMFLTPSSGYDNLLKCLAVAFYQEQESIKLFQGSFDDAEAQILKNVKSIQCEKDFLQTKVIVFLPLNKGITQSVTIIRQSELWKQANQIYIEHKKDPQLQNSIKQEEKMLEYAVVQDNEFQDLRRKSAQIEVNQEDEDKSNLKKYILKMEETLTLKHKLIAELQNRIKELQNQPPQLVGGDADQQLLNANEQLRKRIQDFELEISKYEEAKKYSDKLQDETQQTILTLQKANKDLESQLNSSIQVNRDLTIQVKDYKVSVNTQPTGSSPLISQSPLTPTREKNYQINISLQQKQTEEQLQQKIDEQQQKIFALEQQINQLNKEYVGVQQLNQDKLKVIGNLEIRLVEMDAIQRENERLTLDIAAINKKLEHHELTIIQQQDHLEDLQFRFDDLVKKYANQSEEIDALRVEKRQELEAYQKAEEDLRIIIQDQRRQLEELKTQSTKQIQDLQHSLKEKEDSNSLLQKGIQKGLEKFAQLEVQYHKQMDDDKAKIEERDGIIINKEDEISQLQKELDAKKSTIQLLEKSIELGIQKLADVDSKRKQEIENLTNEITRLKEESDKIHQENQRLQQELEAKISTIQLLEKAIEKGVQKVAELEGKHKQEIQELNNEIQKLRQELENKTSTIQLLEKGIEKGVQKVAEIDAKHKQEIDDKDKEIQKLRQELESKISTIQLLEKAIEKGVQKVAELEGKHKQEIEELNKEIQKLRQQLEDKTSTIQLLEKGIEKGVQKVAEIDAKHKQEIDDKDKEIQKLRQELESKISTIQLLEKAIEKGVQKVAELEGKHKQEIEELNKEIQKLRQQLEEKTSTIQLLEKGIAKGVQKIAELEGKHKQEIEEFQAKIKQFEQDKANQQEKHRLLLIKIEEHLSKVTQLENHNSKLELDIMELEKKNHDLVKDVSVKEHEIIKLIQIIEKQKVELIDNDDLIKQLRKRIEELEKEVDKLQKAIGLLEKEIVKLEKEKITLTKLVKQFKELSEEMAQIS